jgi:outer membrane protein insertion porin family
VSRARGPALSILAVLWLLAAPARAQVAASPSDLVTAVDLLSSQRLPEALVHTALGDLTGHPLSRFAIRQSLARLWALGLFAEAWVDEVPAPGGIRLRFHLTRRPFIHSLAWAGESGLSAAELAPASGLELGGGAGPDRLEQTRRSLLALYRREGYFAAQVEFRVQVEAATQGRDIIVVLQSGAPARIGPIEIRGATGEPAHTLLASLGFERGDRYREEAVRQGVRSAEEKLRQEGFFQATLHLQPPVWNPATNTVPLAIEVNEGRRDRVEFQGNHALTAEALQARLTFSAAGVVDETEVATSARQIETAYREAGFPFVRVSGRLEQESAPPLIRFQVQEGPRVTVEDITFSGNQAFSAERLRGLMETRPPAFLRSGLFRKDILDRDLLLLQAFYRSRGFVDAGVGPAETDYSADRRRVRLRIPIVEGARLSVGSVRLEGATVLSSRGILGKIPLKPGDPWASGQIDEAQRMIERLYAQKGYLQAHVSHETSRQDGGADVLFHIREGAQTRVGRILISGLLLTDPEVVRRELPIHPGDPFDPDALLEAERRLSRLGLFEQVQVGPLRPPPAPFADVEVRLREGRPWHLDLGGGYSTDQKWRGFLEAGHDNLFGTGRSASLRESLSTQGDRTDLSFREPRLLGSPWQGEAALYREQMAETGYDRQAAGGAVAAHRDLISQQILGLQGGLRYRLDWLRRSHVDPTLAAAAVVPGSQIVASLTPSLTLDRRDNPLDPRRGSLQVVSLEAGGTPIGSQVNFLKSRLDTYWYLDWLPPTTLVLSGRFGVATPLGSTPDLAIEDRFFAGGATTIRGYHEKHVGPRDADGNPTGGDALVLLNAEWRFPIWQVISGALFVDSGAVTRTVGDLGRAAFKTGVGVGLRVGTPVGPLRLDVGYPLNPIPREGRWQLYFSIGYPF